MPVSVSRETQTDRYVALLLRWGAAVSLVSSRENTDVALRSLIDGCLAIVPHLPPGIDRLTDLGSGQGFPAIPIAIATGLRIELVEADRRKAAFLTTAMAELGLSGTVHPQRIEAARLAPAQCITARALASVEDLIGLTLPLLAENGCGLFLKGATAAAEVATVPPNPRLRIELLATNRPPATLVKATKLG